MRYAFALVMLAGCGDNSEPGLTPLVEDPAVEVGCLPGPVGGTRAKVVACSEELIGGRLAVGRIGDFVLENAHVRLIIRGAGEGYYLHGSAGGGIVDAAVVGGEDLVKETQPAIDLSAGAFDELVIVEAGDDGAAEIVVRGPTRGIDIVQAALTREPPAVIVEHHYRLAADATHVELETFAFPVAGTEAESHELYDAMFFGSRAPAFVPGRGFEVGTGGAEVIATAGTTTSYGLVYPEGVTNPQLLDLAGIRLVLAADDVGSKPVTRFLVFGDGSVSSVTERAWTLRNTELGVISGTTAPDTEVHVLSGGAPLTIARSDTIGAFRVAVPSGAYTLRAQSRSRGPGTDTDVLVTANQSVTADVTAGPTGTIVLSVHDGDNLPIPARVELALQGGDDERIEFVGASGALTLNVPPGTWRMSVSRGLEYEAFVAANVVVPGASLFAVVLPRVVDTAGWIALDTHLHSELSTDTTFPIDDRLRAVAAEGVEVPVSTDHDIVVDYRPIIAELGLGEWLGTLTGCEVSSLVWGHLNAFPLTVDSSRTGGGATRWLLKSPTEVFAGIHANDGALVQVNHPRDGATSLFNALDLDPATLTARRDPTALGLPGDTDLSDLSFDAIEVANAGSSGDFEQLFDDFLALVAAGHPTAATGSSDSHGASRFAGEARTYVFVGVGNDDPAAIDPVAIIDAIRGRRVVVGTGSFVTAGIVTAGGTSLPGDTVDVTGLAQVTLRIRVQAASWQPLARIRIFQGTQEIRSIDLDPNDITPVRFDANVTVPTPTADTAWVVRVDPAGSGEPVLGSATPAFTNPLFGRVN